MKRSVPFKLIIKICVVFAIIVFAFNSTYFLNGVHGSDVSSKDRELVIKPGAVEKDNVAQGYYYSKQNNDDESDEESDDSEIEDGTHSATVHYYNRNTGYSADYDLDVEFENGEATTIHWPNGGSSEVGDDPDKEYEIEVNEE
jgi:hypothetical protein